MIQDITFVTMFIKLINHIFSTFYNIFLNVAKKKSYMLECKFVLKLYK